MKPTRNLYGIHNDFCGVGGGLRRGCIINKEQRWVGVIQGRGGWWGWMGADTRVGWVVGVGGG